MKQTRTKIALLHHAGCGNLGDTAIIDSVIDNIRLRWGDAEIAVFSMNPDDTAERHGVASYPIRRYRWTSGSPIAAQPSEPGRRGFTDWVKETKNPAIRFPRAVFRELAFFIESYRAVRGFDLLIVSGGGQLTERGGPWSFPYALFVWSLIAKRAGVSWVFLNVGAGPLKHRFSRFFAQIKQELGFGIYQITYMVFTSQYPAPPRRATPGQSWGLLPCLIHFAIFLNALPMSGRFRMT